MKDDRPTAVRSPLRPLVAAGLGGVGLVVVGLLSLGSRAVRGADAAALHGFEQIGGRERITSLAHAIHDLADPRPVLLVTLALAAVALLRGRPRTALGVGLIVLAANLTTQVLKPGLATPRFSALLEDAPAATASWPSGHATGAMSIALCAVLVAAPRWRPAVATIGASFAVAVGYALLLVGAHYPSDVLGGYLVAAVWVLLGAGALRAADVRWAPRTGRAAVVRLEEALVPPLTAVLAALGAAATAFLMRPEAVLAGGARHTSALAAGLAVAALGLSVATALVLALRR